MQSGIRVVGYARVSTDEQAEKGVSLSAQEEKIRLYCQLHGLELVEMIVKGESAKEMNRPGFKRALELLDKGQAEGLVVFKLDRLTRNLGDWTHLIDAYFGEKAGKSLMSVNDSIDTRTAAGRLVLNVLMSVAQWEREAISERTRSALGYKKARGERVGKVPFGWDLDPDGRGLTPNPTEQEALGWIREWDAAGWALRRMAVELDRRGVPPKSGKATWTHTTLVSILDRLRTTAA